MAEKSVAVNRRNKRMKSLYNGMVMKWMEGRKELDSLMSQVPEVYNDPFATTGAYGRVLNYHALPYDPHPTVSIGRGIIHPAQMYPDHGG